MQDIPVKEYFHQVWRRRKVVLVFFLSTVVITALFTLQQPKIYRAVAVIEIGAETPDMAFFQDVMQMSPYFGWWSTMRYYETQYQILRSRSLAELVAARALASGVVSDREMNAAALTGRLQAGLGIETDDTSRLVRLSFNDTDPARAQKLANLVAEVYRDENLAKKLRGISEVSKWINDRLAEINQEKRRKEAELQKYKEEYGIVSMSDRENLAKANLMALTEHLNRLKGQRIEVEAQYRKLGSLVERAADIDDLMGVVTSDLIRKFMHDLAKLRAERNELGHRYGDRHPTMVELGRKITEAENAIRREATSEVNRLKTRFTLAKAEEDSIGEALEKQKLEALRIDEVGRELADIQFLTRTNQDLFETLQRKLKEADLSALVRTNNIRVVDAALLPSHPVTPRMGTNLLLAVLIGLLGGIGLALALEYMDDTIKSQEDIERFLRYPVLGIIPRYRTGEKGQEKVGGVEFVPFEQPSSPVSEFYRTLRTSVLFLAASRKLRTLLVCSTGPSEGKTSLVINLAITMGQIGQKTVMVDLDLRRPKLHRSFPDASRVGASNVMLGEVSLEDAIQKSAAPNLDYLVAGTIPPNPSELLASDALGRLLEDLSRRYERVILDSSPIAPVTDAVVLGQRVDGVIMVVRAGKTHRKAFKFAQEQLQVINVPILGIVLNDVDLEHGAYGNYQYYKYGYSVYSQTSDEPVRPPEATA